MAVHLVVVRAWDEVGGVVELLAPHAGEGEPRAVGGLGAGEPGGGAAPEVLQVGNEVLLGGHGGGDVLGGADHPADVDDAGGVGRG